MSRYYGNTINALWVIYTHAEAVKNIKEYPHIKAHLDKFKPVITSDNKPYGLHRARDERFFLGEKIISKVTPIVKTENRVVFGVDLPALV